MSPVFRLGVSARVANRSAHRDDSAITRRCPATETRRHLAAFVIPVEAHSDAGRRMGGVDANRSRGVISKDHIGIGIAECRFTAHRVASEVEAVWLMVD